MFIAIMPAETSRGAALVLLEELPFPGRLLRTWSVENRNARTPKVKACPRVAMPRING